MEQESPTENIKETQGVKNVENLAVDLDTILLEIGQFGRYQLKTLALLALTTVFIGFAGTEYVFTTARIPTRCLIPECENVEGPVDFEPSWILNAVPGTGDGSFDNCQRFASSSWTNDSNPDDICPATLFDQSVSVTCEQYVYENENTVVYDYGLACDEWRRSLIGSLRSVGNVVALPLVGFISDRWGRRTALTLTAFNTAWLGLVRYWANTYIGFVISQVAESAWGAGFSCCFILMMELVGAKYRLAAGAALNSSYAVGQVIVGVVAWAVPNWRDLTLALYVPQLITIFYPWLISESVRWYMSNGRYEESDKVLEKAARMNGKHLSERSLDALRRTVEEDKRKKALEMELKAKEPWLILLVFRHKPILLRCVVSPICWITMTLIYYGLTVNSVNISENTYLNFCAVAAIEIPGFWTAFILMSKIGRKPVLAGAYWICAACQIGYLFMPDGHYVISLTVYLIGKYTIAMVVTSIYVYTSELYPTKYRHRLFGFSSMMGRFGAIIAPLTPAFGDTLPFILFAGFSLLSGILVLFLPETLGSNLPDTMEEAAHIGKKKNNPH